MEYIRKRKLIAGKSAAEPASMDSMELMVGYILLIGVLLSVGLIITGTIWNMILNHSLSTSFTISSENYFDFFRSSLDPAFSRRDPATSFNQPGHRDSHVDTISACDGFLYLLCFFRPKYEVHPIYPICIYCSDLQSFPSVIIKLVNGKV